MAREANYVQNERKMLSVVKIYMHLKRQTVISHIVSAGSEISIIIDSTFARSILTNDFFFSINFSINSMQHVIESDIFCGSEWGFCATNLHWKW